MKNFSRFFIYFFFLFCSKHRWWVHVRTASTSKKVPLHTPFLLYKSGAQGVMHNMDMFLWRGLFTFYLAVRYIEAQLFRIGDSFVMNPCYVGLGAKRRQTLLPTQPFRFFNLKTVNPYLTNGFSHYYHLVQSLFILRGVRSDF